MSTVCIGGHNHGKVVNIDLPWIQLIIPPKKPVNYWSADAGLIHQTFKMELYRRERWIVRGQGKLVYIHESLTREQADEAVRKHFPEWFPKPKPDFSDLLVTTLLALMKPPWRWRRRNVTCLGVWSEKLQEFMPIGTHV